MLGCMGIETGIDFQKIMAAGAYIDELVKGDGTDCYQQRLRRLAK